MGTWTNAPKVMLAHARMYGAILRPPVFAVGIEASSLVCGHRPPRVGLACLVDHSKRDLVASRTCTWCSWPLRARSSNACPAVQWHPAPGAATSCEQVNVLLLGVAAVWWRVDGEMCKEVGGRCCANAC